MRRVVLLTVVAVALGGATCAFAAGLGVTSSRLTTWTAPSSVPSSTCTLTASADAHADEQSPSASFGSATALAVENGKSRKRAYVRFDIGSCVPAGARILSAELSLYLVDAPTVNRTWELHRVTSSWSEASLTWLTQPSVPGAATGSFATGTTDGVWRTLDVVADVQAGGYGWRLWDQNDSQNPGRGGSFSSREAGSNTPSLTITFYP